MTQAKYKEPLLHRIYIKLLFMFNKKSIINADKVVHISRFARDEYYKQHGLIMIKGKVYSRIKLIQAGFFVDNGVLRHKGEL